MAYEQKDMQWSLFRNNRKEKETHPDYTGSGKIFGREVWVNAWLKETKDGEKYFSGSFRLKEPKPMIKEINEKVEEETRPLEEELNDEIPF